MNFWRVFVIGAAAGAVLMVGYGFATNQATGLEPNAQCAERFADGTDATSRGSLVPPGSVCVVNGVEHYMAPDPLVTAVLAALGALIGVLLAFALLGSVARAATLARTASLR